MDVGFYSTKQVMDLTTLSRTSIWRAVHEGSFPKPNQISRGRKAWPRHKVHDWLNKNGGGEA